MTYAIETDHLSKNYCPVAAVNDVNLRVNPGEVYGFLGLNGAGKTTTIRALLGMIRPSQGTIKVLGHDILPGRRGPWGRVGHLVETPSAYPELTVRENLDVARRLQGVSDPACVTRVMEQLSLTAYAGRRAGALSLGNFQRLGLARALLHQPELLILDEPANGLDPAGIVEIRELLTSLAHLHGTTIFMSSHILTEVARLADRIGIIHQGRLLEELDADKLALLRARRLNLDVRDRGVAHQVLVNAGYAVTVLEDGHLVIQDSSAIEAPEQVATLLVNHHTPPMHLAIEQESLEDYFLRLTGATE